MKIHYIVSEYQGKYICGYRYNNGFRDVRYYVKSVYKGKYKFSYDYTHAKTMSLETAKKHAYYMRDHNIK